MKQLNRRHRQAPKPSEVRVLQFGGGNFLRAFTDWMIDIMNEKTGYDAGVLIIKPTEGGAYRELEQQEGLFHVWLRGIQRGEEVDKQRLISCVSDYIHPYENFESFLESATLPGIQVIVSNTTEAGIQFREADRFEHRPASSFPGKLTQWLYRRYQYFAGEAAKGCVILPCELVENNGDRLKELVLRYADLWELEDGFSGWIEQHHYFCNTLVDRIVPGYPEAEAEAFMNKTGYRDELLVSAEPYHLWAIEGRAEARRRFPADEAGLNVKFVEDIQSIRTLKVRLLNGAHTAMVPLGLLAGLESVRETIENDNTGLFIRDLLEKEIISTLPHPAAEAKAYADTVLERFRNPFIHHRLADIALNSTSKFETRLLPSLNRYFEQHGQAPERLSFTLAALIRFYRGDGPGGLLPLKDEEAAITHLQSAWKCDTLAEVSAKALSLWPLSDELFPILQSRVAAYLFLLSREPILKLLSKKSFLFKN